MKVTVKIVAESTDGTYRYHGLAIDDDLQKAFWVNQKSYIIGASGGRFNFSKDYELGVGRHTIEYGVSAWTGTWTAQIFVNDSLLAEGQIIRENVSSGNFLTASFLIGPMGKVIPVKIPVLNTSMIAGNIPPIMGKKGVGILSKLRTLKGGILARARR